MSGQMYSVVKRIEFCYGHRLVDYEGVCRHPHGHNAVAEIEIRAEALDDSAMVRDFGEIKRVVEAWVKRELDHKMILRQDDPLVEALHALGEPVYVVEANPTAECIARLLYEQVRDAGLPVACVTLWETPSSRATYSDLG